MENETGTQVDNNTTNEEVVDNSTTSSVDYSETLLLISDQLEVNNHLVAGSIFFQGLIGGILLLTIFWNRFTK